MVKDSHFGGDFSLNVALELADATLQWNDKEYPIHTQIVSQRSPVLASLISIAKQSQTSQSGYTDTHRYYHITIPATSPPFVLQTSLQAPFLRLLYSGPGTNIDSHLEDWNVKTAAELVKLAQFFCSPAIVKTLETHLCLLTIRTLSRCPAVTHDEQLVCIWEIATEHRLTRLTSILFPWVISRLNRGPLGDTCCAVWSESKARLDRLQNSMSVELKSIAIEQQWWSVALPSRCATCQCRSGDLSLVIHPSYGPSSGCFYPPPHQHPPHHHQYHQYQPSRPHTLTSTPARLPDAYMSVASHMAHIMAESGWGMTPSSTGSLYLM